jgi:uncharacterized protein (TIGR02246 family)
MRLAAIGVAIALRARRDERAIVVKSGAILREERYHPIDPLHAASRSCLLHRDLRGRMIIMTRLISSAALSAVMLCALGACQKPTGAGEPAADTAAIRAVEDEMRAAYKAKDAAKLAALYAPDATIHLTSERPRVGTDAITKGAAQDFTDPAFGITITTGKIAASGDMGYSKGSFTLRYTNPTTKAAGGYSGYYLTVFRKQADGSWKASEDMTIPAS